MRQPDVWWDRTERVPTPELVSEASLENLAAKQPVPDEVA
jgi:hypothetical protein